MNTSKYISIKAILFFMLISLGAASANAQAAKKDKNEKRESIVKSLIQDRNFVFQAQNAIAGRGMSRSLTTGYDMHIVKDSLVTHLPYFGRAYSPSLDASGGIRFTSTDFDYKIEERRKGGWNIVLTPKDTRDVRQLYLNVSENGYANLQVTSNNREPISFNGIITQKNKQ